MPIDTQSASPPQNTHISAETVLIPEHYTLIVPIAICVLVVAVMFAVFFFSGKCISTCNSCEKNSSKTKTCNVLLKHDFLFAIIFAITGIVFLLSFYFFDSSTAINYFSFAATLSSIILSVVAIFMTISSENKNIALQAQLDSSVNSLESIQTIIEKQNSALAQTMAEFHSETEALKNQLNIVIEATKQIQDCINKTYDTAKWQQDRFDQN